MGDQGRHREQDGERALDALAGDGGLVVIGPCGSGRSALLAAIAAHEQDERRVWWCRGRHAGEASGDRELWSDTADALLRTVAAQPATVLVDDAHLLDDAVLERLVLVAERRVDLGLRLVAARRSGPIRPALARLDGVLLGPGGAFHLGPLTEVDVAQWLVDEWGEAPPRDVDPADLVARTGGWPELVAAELAAPGAGVADLTRARLALLDAGDQRVVRALAFGLPAGSRALTEAVATGHDAIDAAVEAARAAGLVHAGAEPVPAIAAALRATAPTADRTRIASAARACGPSDLVVAVARHLAAGGDRSDEAGALFEAAAEILLPAAPAEAADLLDAAVRAGRPSEASAARRAAAALAAGRAEDAVTLAMRALSAEPAPEKPAPEAPPSSPSPGAGSPDPAPGSRPQAAAPTPGASTGLVRVAGAGWAHLGSPDLAAEWFRQDGDHRVLAVLPLLAAGRGAEARELLSGRAPEVPTAARAFAEGAAAWMAGDSAGALAALERSAQLAQVHGGVQDWPDSPHALLALAAAQWLDTARAERAAGTAADRSVGGHPFAARHRLLLAWAALRGGRLDEARAALEDVPELARDMVRDAVTAAAVAAAVALRTGQPEELPEAHLAASRARQRGAPDPFAPDLAGELAHLAARVGDDPEPILGPLERLSTALAEPLTLAVPLAWARLMVAVARDDAAAARRAAERRAGGARAAAEADDVAARGATGLLADAAVAFADVLDGAVDADAVQAVAARLTERGMVFEASRLVGAASLRCTDAAATRALLGELRRLRATQVRSGVRRLRPAAELSEREREVARALLDGHTHREIGAQLYISAKTVEHHVARIRQKLGATATRSDLLAAIREELDRIDDDADEAPSVA